MKVLLVGSRHVGTKNDPSSIYQGIVDAGGNAELIYWEDLQLHAKTGEATACVDRRDVLSDVQKVLLFGWYKSGRDSIYRDVAYAFSLIAAHKQIEVWNSEALAQRSTTKLSCMVQLAIEGVQIPETWFSLGDTVLVHQRTFPYIAKAISASRGRDNYLIQDDVMRADVTALHHEKRFMVQEYLENDHDLRVVCFGGRPKLVLRRSRSDTKTHLNNTSQGAVGEWLDIDTLPSQLLTECSNICIITKREMAGIDFIPARTSPYGYSCLEVNAIPQLTSGFGVDKKMATLIETILK